MLEALKKQGCHEYACIFDQVPAAWKNEDCVSVHSIEIPYVFGDWYDSTGWWASVYMLTQQVSVKTADPGFGTIDRNVSEAIMGLWTSFAKTGIPRAQGVPDWPEYSANIDQYLNVCGCIWLRSTPG